MAISLTHGLKAKKKSGFVIDEWENASPIFSKAEEYKWLTGIFDDLNKLNNRHYVEEVFDICGFDLKDEEYIIEIP